MIQVIRGILRCRGGSEARESTKIEVEENKRMVSWDVHRLITHIPHWNRDPEVTLDCVPVDWFRPTVLTHWWMNRAEYLNITHIFNKTVELACALDPRANWIREEAEKAMVESLAVFG